MKQIYISAVMLFFGLAVKAQTSIDPSSNPGDTGTVTFTYNGETVQYTTVLANDGNIWLQQNLGSSQVATSSTDEDAYGDLFQWGRWDDGHQLRTSTLSGTLPSPNNPTGLGTGSELFYGADPEWWNSPGEAAATDTWSAATPADVTATNGCDPCRALGDGWHLPTQPEWVAVIDAEGITDPADASTSNLKITAAGNRGGSGNFGSVGVRGYYWSSTPSDNNANFAKYWYITSITNNPNAGGFREQGSSVRCMKPAAAAGTHGFYKTKVALYPNPVSGIATIQSIEAVQQYSVYSNTGSLVQHGNGNSVSFETLPTGLYIVKITLENGSTQAVKVLRN